MEFKGCPTEIMLCAYLDGELSNQIAREVEDHLHGCAACNAVCKNLEATDNLLISWLPVPDPPTRMKHNLMERIRQHEGMRVRWFDVPWNRIYQTLRHSLTNRLWIPVTAAILILALPISLQQIRHHQEKERLLSEIDRFKFEWITKIPTDQNPFDIDGDLFRLHTDNPFASYLEGH